MRQRHKFVCIRVMYMVGSCLQTATQPSSTPFLPRRLSAYGLITDTSPMQVAVSWHRQNIPHLPTHSNRTPNPIAVPGSPSQGRQLAQHSISRWGRLHRCPGQPVLQRVLSEPFPMPPLLQQQRGSGPGPGACRGPSVCQLLRRNSGGWHRSGRRNLKYADYVKNPLGEGRLGIPQPHPGPCLPER